MEYTLEHPIEFEDGTVQAKLIFPDRLRNEHLEEVSHEHWQLIAQEILDFKIVVALLKGMFPETIVNKIAFQDMSGIMTKVVAPLFQGKSLQAASPPEGSTGNETSGD